MKEKIENEFNTEIPDINIHPSLSPNFTQLPNIIIDVLRPLLPMSEFNIILTICRKTYGWHKASDNISISQMVFTTGMKEETISKAIKSLEEKNIIIKTKGNPKKGSEYSLVMNVNEWDFNKGAVKSKNNNKIDYMARFKDYLNSFNYNDTTPIIGGGVPPLSGEGVPPLSGEGVPPLSGDTKEILNKNKEKINKPKDTFSENEFKEMQDIFLQLKKEWDSLKILPKVGDSVFKNKIKKIKKTSQLYENLIIYLEDYKIEGIIKAFKNYAEILENKNKYYFSHGWNIFQFIQRENALINFADKANPLNNYIKTETLAQKKERERRERSKEAERIIAEDKRRQEERDREAM
jgi:phage replication O-like protein O